MEDIISNDPTLNNFINRFDIDWYNEYQINLRCEALKIALWKYLDKKY